MNWTRHSEHYFAPQKPIASTIAKGLISILIFVIVAIIVATFTITYSLKDAEMINVAGSLRMQSYRLAYDIKTDSDKLQQHSKMLEKSLNSPVMKSLDNPVVPNDIKYQYLSIQNRWHGLSIDINTGREADYLTEVEALVEQLDTFVLNLQRFSENKLKVFAFAGAGCLLLIFIVTMLIMRFVRNKIVKPLEDLVIASQSIQIKILPFSLILIPILN